MPSTISWDDAPEKTYRSAYPAHPIAAESSKSRESLNTRPWTMPIKMAGNADQISAISKQRKLAWGSDHMK